MPRPILIYQPIFLAKHKHKHTFFAMIPQMWISHRCEKDTVCTNGDRIFYTNFVVQNYIEALKTEHFLLLLLHIKSIQITKCRDVVFLCEAITGNLVYLTLYASTRHLLTTGQCKVLQGATRSSHMELQMTGLHTFNSSAKLQTWLCPVVALKTTYNVHNITIIVWLQLGLSWATDWTRCPKLLVNIMVISL